MKFGQEFKVVLLKEGYPPRWVDSAIPYGQLKKCLKKVRQELNELGLEPETLRQLLAAHTTSDGDSVPMASYELGGSTVLRPRLTVFIHLEDGTAVDASLTPASKGFLKKLSSGRFPTSPISESPQSSTSSPRESSPDRISLSSSSAASENTVQLDAEAGPASSKGPVLQRIEVPLTFDGEFFDTLQADVSSLDALQDEEEVFLTKDIVLLGEEMTQLTKPHKFHKSDLSRWRDVFEIYLDAQIFFSTHERDHGPRTSVKALEQLVWFQGQVNERGLVQQFKLPASREAYVRFLDLNSKFLQSLKFQEINKVAVTKILKKFDKKTCLGASQAFPRVVQSKRFLSESVAKDLCAQVSTQVVSTVPRVDDYACPICMSIAWLPVRLDCRHVFCVRCIVKMQRDRKRQCPMCRQVNVMQADLRNLDHELARFLSLYFKKETKEKQAASDLERGIEMFGEDYKPSNCVVM